MEGVTVYLRRSSDKQILAYDRLSVTVETSSNIISNLSYPFENFGRAASLSLCQYMFDNRVANTVFNARVGAGGNCFGMSATAGMFYTSGNGINPSSFASSKSSTSQLARSDRNSSWQLTVEEYVQAMQISQVATSKTQYFVSGSSLKNLVSNVNAQMILGRPTLIGVWGMYGGEPSGHAVLAYGVENVNDTTDRLLLYDNNYPLQTRYLYLYKNSSGYTGWYYEIFDEVNWGSSYDYAYISYMPYTNYVNLWNNRGNLTTSIQNLLVANSKDLTIKDVDDQVVATVKNGVLETENKQIEEVKYVSLQKDGQLNENYMLRLPVDLYTIQNDKPKKEDFTVEMVNEELSARVVCAGDEVTLCADDSCNLASVLLDAKEKENYQITLGSSRTKDPAELEWSGVGTGDTVSARVENGTYDSCNTEDATFSIKENNNEKPEDSKDPEQSKPAPSEVKTEKVDNQIHADDLQKTTAKREQSFSIDASSLGNAPLTYTSNQKNVKITSDGKVTIAKNYVGKVLITITAEETAAYKKTTKTITLLVRPEGTSITNI